MQFCTAVKSMLLKKFIRWPSTAVMEKFAQDFLQSNKFHMWLVLLTALISLSWHPDYMLPIITIGKGSIMYSYRALCLASAYFGILILDGRDQCMMPTWGHGRRLDNSVRLDVWHRMHSLAMLHIPAAHRCWPPIKATKTGSHGKSTIGITYKVRHACASSALLECLDEGGEYC